MNIEQDLEQIETKHDLPSDEETGRGAHTRIFPKIYSFSRSSSWDTKSV